MDNRKEHIDDIFRSGLEDHEIPLTDEDRALFDKSVTGGITKPFLNPKYIKWLPYLAALSAAASSIYFVPKLFNNKDFTPPTTQQVTTINKKPNTVAKSEDSLSYIQQSKLLTIKKNHPTPGLRSYSTPKYITDVNTNNFETNTISLLKELKQAQLPVILNSGTLLNNYRNTHIENSSASSNDNEVYIDDSMKTKPEFIVSLGYERSGLSSPGLSSILLSGYLKYAVSPKLQVGIQPTFKFGYAQTINLPEQQVAYSTPIEDVYFEPSQTQPGLYNYYFMQTYDSLTYNYTFDNSTWDIELPVQLEFSLLNKLSVFAGIKFLYGKLPQINSSETLTTVIYTDSVTSIPIAPVNANGIFRDPSTYISDDISSYQNPQYNSLRAGYMLGMTLTPVKKLHVSVSLHQNASDLSHIPNMQLRRMYNTPQVRFSLGYKVF